MLDVIAVSQAEEAQHRGQGWLLAELRTQQIRLELQNEELRSAQAKLDELRDDWLSLYDLSPVAYLTLDEAGRIQTANAAALDLLGSNDLAGRPLVSFMERAAADRLHLHLRAVLRTGARAECDLTLRRGGTQVRVVSNVTTRGELLTALTDISERRTAEMRLRLIVERIEDVFYILDRSTHRTMYVSPSFGRVFGRERMPESIGEYMSMIIPDDRERVRSAIMNFVRGDPLDIEYRIMRPDRRVVVIHDRAFPADDGLIAGVARDVTEERRLEEHLMRAQKLEAVGTLASGIAHDFNNLLMGLSGCAAVALRKLQPGDPATASSSRFWRPADGGRL